MWWERLRPVAGFYQACIALTGIAAFIFRLMGDKEASVACFVTFAFGVGAYGFVKVMQYIDPS